MKDYKKILEGVVNIVNAIENSDIGFDNIRTYLGENCPELQESEDEKIRKELIEALRATKVNGYHYVSSNLKIDDAIYWLERQGDYSKLVEEIKKRKELFSKEKENATSDNDKLSLGGRIAMLEELLVFSNEKQEDLASIEPKFGVGDWVVNNDSDCIYQIKSIKNYEYCLWSLDSNIEGFLRIDNVDNNFHLWDITKDAKKGDVLVHNGITFIFMGIENGIVQAFEENLLNGKKTCNFGEPDKDGDYHPATKEQCDLLCQKMKEADCEFDFDKKELKKIEDEPENFKQQLISEMADLVKDYIQQKSAAWAEDDDGLLELTEAAIEDFYDDKNPLRYRLIDWLKSLKQRIGG